MNRAKVLGIAICAARVSALGASFTGALTSPEDVFQTTAEVTSSGDLTLQTWSFGGGINAAETVIPAGGIDPLVAVFMGTGPSAILVNGTSDALSNYSSFTGCPPAGLVTIGAIAGNCGDITMAVTGLTAGTYTVLLSDADYIPNAIFDNGTLSEGFTDLTGGAFQTCADLNDCNTDTANWALDISTGNSPSAPVPEPDTAGIAALGLAGIALRQMKK